MPADLGARSAWSFRQTPYDVEGREPERCRRGPEAAIRPDTLDHPSPAILEEARDRRSRRTAYESDRDARAGAGGPTWRGYGGKLSRPLTGLPGRFPTCAFASRPAAARRFSRLTPSPLARDAWIEKDWPLASVARSHEERSGTQTAEALEGPTQHPVPDGCLTTPSTVGVRVFDIADFAHDPASRPSRPLLHRRRHDPGSCASTNTEGAQGLRAQRRPRTPLHAVDSSAVPEGLETLDDGEPKFSFANLLHMHRPLMIVDEAHNAVTGLTREDAGAREPLRHRRVHRHAAKEVEHPAQRDRERTEGRAHDQAARHALGARHLAGTR